MRIAVLDGIRSSFGLRDGSIFTVIDRSRGNGTTLNRRPAPARRPRRVIVNQLEQRPSTEMR